MKKLLVCILAMLILMTGCSGKDTQPAGGTSTEPEVVETPAEEPEEVVAEEPEETAPEEPEEEVPPQTYVEENGLEFCQDTTFTIQGTRYNPDNLSDYEFTNIEEKILSIDVEDSETEGYEVITIKTSGFGYSGVFGDAQRIALLVPGMSACDTYTGKVAKMKSTLQDAKMSASNEIEWNGETYSIEYETAVEWDFGDWTTDAEGNDVVPGTCYADHTITIPKGYDGLGLVVYPNIEGPSGDSVTGSVDVDVAEEYIMDKWIEGSYLFKVSDLYEILNASE